MRSFKIFIWVIDVIFFCYFTNLISILRQCFNENSIVRI